MPRPTAVLYVRLSVTDDTSTSIARQEADLRERAAREGWDVAEVIPDDGMSGGRRRANADRALAMLADGRADVLAVWKFDRWSRMGLGAVADLVAVIDARPGALFVADRDGLRSDQPAWRIIASVLAEVARMERDNTAARVTSSVAALRRANRYSGGTVPYGYSPAANPKGPGRVLVLDEAEAVILREAADRLLSGQTLYRVATDLNARGVPTRRGAPWSVQALLQMLRSDTVVGRVVHHGDVVRDEAGMPVQVWPPVLSADTWGRVRAVLNADVPRELRPAQRRRRSRLLSAIATCAHCGTPLYTKDAGDGSPAYMCPTRGRGRGDRCPGMSASVRLLDKHIVGEYLRRVGDLEMYERRESTGPDADTSEVERAIKETTSALGEAAEDQMAALLGRLAALKARRDDLRTRPRGRTVTLVPTGRTHRQAWEDAAEDLDERRALIAAAFASITVAKGTRGRRGFDASRVTLLMRPNQVLDGGSAQGFRPGAPTVLLEDDGVDAGA